MSRDNTMWGKRSITQFLLEGAAEDVSQLLPLAEEMASHLGSIWVGHVIALSDSYSQTHWDASDKEPATHGMTVLPTLAPWLSKLHVKIPDQEDYKHDDYLAGTTD